MVEGQEVPQGTRVVCETVWGHADLRLGGMDRPGASSWWIGMYDSDGVLRRTWLADGSDLAPGDLARWLRPLVGHEIAKRLVNMVVRAQGRPEQEPPRLVALR